jgi:hypothetical protein
MMKESRARFGTPSFLMLALEADGEFKTEAYFLSAAR